MRLGIDGRKIPESRQRGVADFGAILKILADAGPDLNITIENFEPYENGPKPARVDRLEIADPSWSYLRGLCDKLALPLRQLAA